eukprot:501020-Alexandrium_andersonii.AAC.1
MSASLVGSEMCIRDRGIFLPGVLRTVNSAAHEAMESPSERGAGGLDEGCLLYTSDAADDM